jgi:hypothetical protein
MQGSWELEAAGLGLVALEDPLADYWEIEGVVRSV